MRIVSIESPFKPSADDISSYIGRYSAAELLRQNLIYARLALRDSLKRGEAPFASHLLYTQVFSETEELRALGLMASSEMQHRMDLIVLYADIGVSDGMKKAAMHARLIDVQQTRRSIIDVTSGRDARETLAKYELGSFPYLEELQGADSNNVLPFRRDSSA